MGCSCSHFDCRLSCKSVPGSLFEWDIAAGTGDNYFSPPHLSRSSEDGPISNGSLVPVARHKIHVFADRDATIMNGKGSAGASKLLLYGNVSGVRERLVGGNSSGHLNDLLAGARRVKVVALIKFS